jgi:hypothetical protein
MGTSKTDKMAPRCPIPAQHSSSLDAASGEWLGRNASTQRRFGATALNSSMAQPQPPWRFGVAAITARNRSPVACVP